MLKWLAKLSDEQLTVCWTTNRWRSQQKHTECEWCSLICFTWQKEFKILPVQSLAIVLMDVTDRPAIETELFD